MLPHPVRLHCARGSEAYKEHVYSGLKTGPCPVAGGDHCVHLRIHLSSSGQLQALVSGILCTEALEG